MKATFFSRSGVYGNMRKTALAAMSLALLLAGCYSRQTPSPGPERTGGGAITPYKHSARIQDASGTGSSPGAFGAGPVPGSGASGETNNAESPSESNGGVPLSQNPDLDLLSPKTK
jgi:hypothetical protein